MNRRKFLKNSLSLAGAVALIYAVSPLKAFADTNLDPVAFGVPNTGTPGQVGNVVVVGGGMAGATIAKYLRLWGGSGVKVTLVEKNDYYISNIMSNTVLNGQRTIDSLSYNWNELKNRYGIEVIKGEAKSIDALNKIVTVKTDLQDVELGYGRLVLAPGIEFDLFNGMESVEEYETKIPHAWQAGPQTNLLRSQLLGMNDGDTVVLAIPLSPYRCPPGPYERACVIADWLKNNRRNSKLIVLDANSDIIVEKDNFSNAFNVIYNGIVDYRSSVTITSINPDTKTVTYSSPSGGDSIVAKVLNAIPQQRAPKLLADAGLCHANYQPNLTQPASERFAPVDVLSFESTLKSNIHIIGDASHTTMPKAGHIGNQEAKTCADAILRLLIGKTVDPAPVLNSACYTPITSTTATWLSAVYQYDKTTGTMIIPAQHNPGPDGKGRAIAATGPTTKNYEEMQEWFAILMGDTFDVRSAL